MSNPTIDLASIRLDQSFLDDVGVEKKITYVPIKKPNKQEFIRVNPDPNFRLDVLLVETEEVGKKETYLISPKIKQHAEDWASTVRLYTCVNRRGDLFLWCCKIPSSGSPVLAWHATAELAAKIAETKWTRVVPNIGTGSYDAKIATGELTEPAWPDLSFNEILTIALKDRIIDDPGHPVLKRLRGEL